MGEPPASAYRMGAGRRSKPTLHARWRHRQSPSSSATAEPHSPERGASAPRDGGVSGQEASPGRAVAVVKTMVVVVVTSRRLAWSSSVLRPYDGRRDYGLLLTDSYRSGGGCWSHPTTWVEVQRKCHSDFGRRGVTARSRAVYKVRLTPAFRRELRMRDPGQRSVVDA
jgi:hypothetical protein